MKKAFLFLAFAVLLAGCAKNHVDADLDLISCDASFSDNDYSDILNDLLYRDYGTGIRLTGNSKLVISRFDLDLKEEEAVVYIINLEKDEVVKQFNFEFNRDISYSVDSDGVFAVFAKLRNGDIVDLTPKAAVEITYKLDDSGGFIPLK